MAQQDMSQQAHCYWLATPLVPAGTVINACTGHFRQPGVSDVVLNNGSELHVLRMAAGGRLVTLFRQPVLCQVRDLQVLPFSSSSSSSCVQVTACDTNEVSGYISSRSAAAAVTPCPALLSTE
jgi:hypothetical protein